MSSNDMSNSVMSSSVELTKSVYAALERGDIRAVLDHFDAGIEWREAEGNPAQLDGRPWFGRDAVDENLFAKIGAGWDNFAVRPSRIHDAGDMVVVEGRYTGVVKASGTAVDAQFCHIWRVGGGKMRSFQQYVDTAQLQGAMPRG